MSANHQLLPPRRTGDSTPLPPPDHPATRLVPQLVRLGFLRPAEAGLEQAQPAPDVPWLGDGSTLSAPETVHLAITTRCNLSCPGCYVLRPDTGPGWTVAELRGLIDQWARMRVLQLAVGGGEPLLYEGLLDVLAYAREHGIVPSLTTNGTLLNPDVVRRLEWAGVARVNVSWNGPGGGYRGRSQIVTRVLQLLLERRPPAAPRRPAPPARRSERLAGGAGSGGRQCAGWPDGGRAPDGVRRTVGAGGELGRTA